MDHATGKRLRNDYHSKEIQRSETKVTKFAEDSNVDFLSNEKNNASSESDLYQERVNRRFVSVYTDEDLSGDPLELHSSLQDNAQVHINIDRDISNAEDSEKCIEHESIDHKELKVIQKIKQWIIDNKIPHEHANKLLKILKARLLPSIPLSTETLLQINEPDQNNVNYDNELNINIPVTDVSNDECKSHFEASVLTQLESQQSYMQRMENKLDNFADILLPNVCSSKKYDIDFKTKYNLSFPINEKHLFMLFDQRLRSDKFLQNDVCLALNKCIDKDYSILKSFKSMIRAFMKTNVVIQYTASRHSKENAKDIFKSTQFYECMEGVILEARNAASLPACYTRTEILSLLSVVLTNAKKWN